MGYEKSKIDATLYTGRVADAEPTQIAQTYTVGRNEGIVTNTGVFEDALSHTL